MIHCVTKEKPERSHAAVLRRTLFLGRTATLAGSIFELAKLHSRIHFRCYGKWSAWSASVLDPQCRSSTDAKQPRPFTITPESGKSVPRKTAAWPLSGFSLVLHCVLAGLRSETSPDYARVSFYLCLRPMNNEDRMTP